jgi:hypothetical protein
MARSSLKMHDCMSRRDEGRPSHMRWPLQVNARLAKRADDRHWHGALPVFAGAVALVIMPAFMGRVTWAAFACLSLAAAGIWAIHGPLLSWPAAILRGTNAAAGVPFEDHVSHAHLAQRIGLCSMIQCSCPQVRLRVTLVGPTSGVGPQDLRSSRCWVVPAASVGRL